MLSVRQPHAEAIVAGWKEVENRTWAIPRDLPAMIALHASQTVDPRGLDVSDFNDQLPDDLPRGVIIGVVEVVSCSASPSSSPWAHPNMWHWQLARPRRLIPPVPCRGRLRLFTAPPDVARQVWRQL